MGLSIKNDKTERLARQVASETGESITQAIRTALEERLARVRKSRRAHILKEKLEGILHRLDRLPPLDTRTEDEILGYDAQGLPTRGHR